MNQAVDGIISVALAIVGIAIVAVLVSRNAQTGNVIRSGFAGLSQAIGAAVAPVSGSVGVGTGYGGGFSF